MSINITNLGGTVNYNDNHKEYSIDARGRDLSEIMNALDAQDIEPVEDSACSEKDQASTTKKATKGVTKQDDILPIPAKGKYTQVRRYIEERSKYDKEFQNFVERHSRVDLCIYLTDLFGWDVDPHHLGVNVNRNR